MPRPPEAPPAAHVFTIPPGESFVDALAAGLWEENRGEPLALAETLILLPNRRAARALRDAFLRLSDGRPLLLPRMRPIGDADEDEVSLAEGEALQLDPAMPPLRRQLLLATLIQHWWSVRREPAPTPEQAVTLAAELGRLLDQVQAETLGFAALAELVPEDFAQHWSLTLDFLKIVTENWPALLRTSGYTDVALRRDRLLRHQAETWERQPPAFPILAAGVTGSIPATARLLSVVARLPRGRLVLPGLDREMEPEGWASLDETHPQYGLGQLLRSLDLAAADVSPWPGTAPGRRAWLVSEALRPAATTEAWRRLAGRGAEAAAALDGVTRLDCPSPREEAGAIALMMRATLEEAGKTAALVTPDRDLARRVAAELRRFDILVDDSAGRPLSLTMPGAFLLLTAEMVAEAFAPHALLAALKHPLARGGQNPGAFRRRVRQLELAVLRGPRPAPGITGLRAAVAAAAQPPAHGRRPRLAAEEARQLDVWLAGLAGLAEDFRRLMAEDRAPLGTLLRAHIAFAEQLAADAGGNGAQGLWSGDAGQVAADFVADLAAAADAAPPLAGRGYPGLLRGLMAGQAVRPSWGGHPRLSIWGPLEARLQHADLLILGGLNEGSWPPQTAADPWMSRPMRSAFGLPLPERRIGLSAHDFAQGFCAPRVVLTRASRVEGTPTVPSRWLLRLEAVLGACGLPAGALAPAPWLAWHGGLDRPERFLPVDRPAPRPPVAARPRELSATAVETWMRDPYAIYARRILRLEALEPIDADPGAADYGDIVHRALDAFLTAHPRGPLGDGAMAELLERAAGLFAPVAAAHPGLAAFWWPRFQRVAGWFIAQETARRALVAQVHSEVSGRLQIAGPAGPFTVTARADRIDLLQDGSLALIDYKTGAPPTAKEVAAGYAPQLPLEALIAHHGGFSGLPGRPVSQLLYWRLKGGEAGGEERPAGEDPTRLAQEALEGLSGLVAAFDNPDTPYEARPHPDKAPKYSDYLHLARVKEWAAAGEESEE